MVRPLDVATQGAVRDRVHQAPRTFIVIRAKNRATGEEEVFGFTDFGEDVSTNVVDGNTQDIVNHSFYGDGSPIQKMDSIPLKIGLEIDTVSITLNALQPQVRTMVITHDCRNARVEIYRGYLDSWSGLLVANPRCRKLGQVNGAPKVKGRRGSPSTITLKVVGATRLLTRTSRALRSDESLKLRSGDRARRYGGTAFKWPIRWGEAEDDAGTSGHKSTESTTR
ncbi:hypothetical protein [Devosia sp. SL43]|uniref:hypothetical protein n=1 Tax=Devosia sp. SL43 TaxID=2806348 RepID=UPI001F396ABF|nr:hypothetical protein [Devosia sp. SL43]UJW87951.1 hypothetical protein IM737_20570 [Devosia sp. SL43]